MNTVRKRLSGVKGGRFAQACAPAAVYAVVLSDIIGDPAGHDRPPAPPAPTPPPAPTRWLWRKSTACA